MMRWIVGSSLKFRFLVVAGAAALIAFGILQLRDSPVDVFPEFAPPRVEIQTLESRALRRRSGRSWSRFRWSRRSRGCPGSTRFARSRSRCSRRSGLLRAGDRPQLKARQLVQERVGTVTPKLPTWAAPPFMIQPLSATSRVMKIGLSSDDVSLIDMSILAYWKIRARLLRVPGVANAPIWGERLHMFQVEVDPQRMAANRVSLNQVMESTANALDVGHAALLVARSRDRHRRVRRHPEPAARRSEHVQPIVTPDALAKVTLAERDGKKLLLSDVATSPSTTSRSPGDAVINDGPGLMLIVEKLPWANTLDVTRGVEEAIDEMRPGLPGIADRHDHLPAGDLYRGVDRQPEDGADHRLHPRDSRDRSVPLRVACRLDQPRRDAAFSGGRRARALPARGQRST